MDETASMNKIKAEGMEQKFRTLANKEQLVGQYTLDGDIIYQPLPAIDYVNGKHTKAYINVTDIYRKKLWLNKK